MAFVLDAFDRGWLCAMSFTLPDQKHYFYRIDLPCAKYEAFTNLFSVNNKFHAVSLIGTITLCFSSCSAPSVFIWPKYRNLYLREIM